VALPKLCHNDIGSGYKMLYTCLVATHTVELASLNVRTCPALLSFYSSYRQLAKAGILLT